MVAFETKPVNFGQHPLQESLGRSSGNTGPLELPDFPALAVDLCAHPLDSARSETLAPISMLTTIR
jgi:hypothetical protein